MREKKEIVKKIYSFLRKTNYLKFIDPNIFEMIDQYKETSDFAFYDYFLEYIRNLPKLDFASAIKISREVYELYGKEEEFDEILAKLIENHNIDTESLNNDDSNQLTKATENKILLSGTYYDVVLLCHEIGHKLGYANNRARQSDMTNSLFFEVPSIMLEFAAGNHLRDNYGVDIDTENLRKMHISSKKKDDSIENNIFLTTMKMSKEGKLDLINLYREFIKNPDIAKYLGYPGTSIKSCVDDGMLAYSYDVGYILANYANSSDNKVEMLNMFLKYNCNGVDAPFTIKEDVIKDALGNPKYIK